MRSRAPRALALAALLAALLLPAPSLAQPAPPTDTPAPAATATPTQVQPTDQPVSPPASPTEQPLSTLDSIGLAQDELPEGFVPVPPYFLRFQPWDVGGDTSWHEFAQGANYVESTVAEQVGPVTAWRALPAAVVPEPGYAERWLDPPAVGDEAALFQITEQAETTRTGYQVKWRRGKFLGRVTVIGLADDPSVAVSLAQAVDARMQQADPGTLEQPPESDITRIASQAQALRGLPQRGRVQFGMVAPGALPGLGGGGGGGGSQFAPLDLGLLELLGQPADTRALQAAAVGEGGFYDPSGNRVVLFGSSWPLSQQEQIIVAHEYTHVVEDQHFALDTIFRQAQLSTAPSTDANTAIRSLAEGDAEFTSRLWTEQELGPDAWAASLAEEDRIYDESAVPPLWRTQFLFPYREGSDFVEGFYRDGGWAEVNMLYGRPPISSEQVIHPDKYLADERPVEVKAPPVGPAAERGWRTLQEDTLGEAGLRATLQPFVGLERAASAAAGWGGDRYVLVGLDEQNPVALSLDSAWDNADEAREFFATLADAQDARFSGQATRRYAGASAWSWATADTAVRVALDGDHVRFVVGPDAASVSLLARTR